MVEIGDQKVQMLGMKWAGAHGLRSEYPISCRLGNSERRGEVLN